MADGLQQIPDEEILREIEADNEKDYLRQLKKKNKGFLVNIDSVSRERIAEWISDQISDSKGKHTELSDKIDDWDRTFRMERKPVVGADADMPNYVMPLSTSTLEVVHANIMNVFFTPNDVMNVLPTEEGDIPKVKKLNTFGNWSMKNEFSLFEKIDQLFHSSGKNGESPYMVHWKKEYGTEIKRVPLMNPSDPSEPMIDPDTQQVVFQEVEEQKLLFNGPVLEVFSRKDYFQPKNALMDRLPDWEARRIRITFDSYLRDQLQGKMYPNSIDLIKDWGVGNASDPSKEDYEGDEIPAGKWEKEFVEFYGRMRINTISDKEEDDTDDIKELEDEFIAIVNLDDGVLCSLRRNKFPLKMRPIGMDYLIPDDDGRRSGLGVFEIMESQQRAYDALWNQFVWGTIQSNNPIIFFEPTGNMRNEPMKLANGFAYPTSNAGSVKLFQLPSPNSAIQVALELVNRWAEVLFGISPFSAGVESTVDPDAPAKKAELLVQQGNVRLNAIIKRKNKTLKDIFKRWFLLYKDNMPPNKFMRVAGAGENAFEFNPVTLEDFALQSIPDFELTGNILNQNKALEAAKALRIYTIMLQNPFFAAQSAQGLRALHSLTKWLLDKMDEMGISKFLPEAPGENVQTPEEENARFLQGDTGEPAEGEDHIRHIQVHRGLLNDPTVPDEIRENVGVHIQATIKQMQEDLTQQAVMSEIQGGGNGGFQRQGAAGGAAQGPAQGLVPEQQGRVGGFEGGVQNL